jgi:periplasmic protein TonB
MTATAPLPNFFRKHRIAVIMGAVLMFHALAIWALQSGLLSRAVELVVPVDALAQIIEPPKPVAPPPPPVVPKEPPPPMKQAVVKPTPPVPQTQAPPQAPPQILAVETPAPHAPAAVQIATPAPLLTPSMPVAAVASPAPVPVPPVPAKVVLPSSYAEYLSNPKPVFPPMSKRLGEQGNVKVRIFIGADGLPKKAELQQTSGYERLDQAALAAVMQWRFVPGKRGGVAEDMWMGTTIAYVLD